MFLPDFVTDTNQLSMIFLFNRLKGTQTEYNERRKDPIAHTEKRQNLTYF